MPAVVGSAPSVIYAFCFHIFGSDATLRANPLSMGSCIASLLGHIMHERVCYRCVRSLQMSVFGVSAMQGFPLWGDGHRYHISCTIVFADLSFGSAGTPRLSLERRIVK